jgi:hypothetical protein
MEPAVLPRPPLTRRCLALPVPLCYAVLCCAVLCCAVLCAPIGSPSRCTDSRLRPIPAYSRFPVTIPAYGRFPLTADSQLRFPLTADSRLRFPLTADSQLRFRLTADSRLRFALTSDSRLRPIPAYAAVWGAATACSAAFSCTKTRPSRAPTHPIPLTQWPADRRCGRSSHACR